MNANLTRKLLTGVLLATVWGLPARSDGAAEAPEEQPAPAGRQPAEADTDGPAASDERTSPAKEPPAPDRAKLEQKFARTMSGATLVGFFTVTGNDKPPAEEKYTITKVTKLKGDYWLFATRIQFGGKDVTVPLMIPVKWAGDTPVIAVTDLGVPGLGTYTARVLVYDDQYAGTWAGHDHGGHLWGRIERADAKEAKDGAAGEGAQESPPEPAAPAGESSDEGAGESR